MTQYQHTNPQRLSTPFGAPSDDYTIAHIDGNDKIEVVFLPRHGRGHTVTPSEINYRANVFGMKSLGVEWIVSVTAVGSLCENKSPGEMVLVNQVRQVRLRIRITYIMYMRDSLRLSMSNG